MVQRTAHRSRDSADSASQSATLSEACWLRDTLNREGKGLGSCVRLQEDGSLLLQALP